MAERPARDILAEWLRRERVGLMRPFWQEAVAIDDAACEQIRRRADFIIRGLDGDGIALVRTGGAPARTPTSDIIYRYSLAGRAAERLIRYAGGNIWEIVIVENGVETVEQCFNLRDATINAGLVLTDAPQAKSIAGLGRQLAALVEVFRVHAQGGGK